MEQNKEYETVEYVDDTVCARIPDLPEINDTSEWAEQQRRLHKIITTNNMHDCTEKSQCLVNGKCTKRFPKAFSNHTVLSGFFIISFFKYII